MFFIFAIILSSCVSCSAMNVRPITKWECRIPGCRSRVTKAIPAKIRDMIKAAFNVQSHEQFESYSILNHDIYITSQDLQTDERIIRILRCIPRSP